MDNSPDVIRVRHMLEAIEEALGFAKGKQASDLADNRMLALALTKEIELIGEAASKLTLQYKQKHSEIPWQQIVATRNRLIHGYYSIDYGIVWTTVERELPKLETALKTLLEDGS